MNEPDDRVLICVVNRKRDLRHILSDGWYRVPADHMPDGIQAEVLGFYVSKSIEAESGGVRYLAQVAGVELVYRRWILPEEPDHPRADKVYYRVALRGIVPKIPPILNPARYSIHFIRTTWARFNAVTTIHELYH